MQTVRGQYDEGDSLTFSGFLRRSVLTMTPPPKLRTGTSRGNPIGLLGKNPALRRIRAIKIVHALLEPGASHASVAKAMGISKRTVEREIAYAEKEGILKEAQEMLAQELIPRAMEVFRKHLQMQLERADKKGADPPDLDAAKEVLKGTHILAGTNQPTLFEDKQTEVLTLSAYYEQRKLDAPEPERDLRVTVAPVQSAEEPRDGELLRGDDDQRADDQGTGSEA